MRKTNLKEIGCETRRLGFYERDSPTVMSTFFNPLGRIQGVGFDDWLVQIEKAMQESFGCFETKVDTKSVKPLGNASSNPQRSFSKPVEISYCISLVTLVKADVVAFLVARYLFEVKIGLESSISSLFAKEKWIAWTKSSTCPDFHSRLVAMASKQWNGILLSRKTLQRPERRHVFQWRWILVVNRMQ